MQTIRNADTIIKVISIIFSLLFLVHLLKMFWTLGFMFAANDPRQNFKIILYFMQLIDVPTAIIMFFKHKKVGWTLLATFLTYSIVCSVEHVLLPPYFASSSILALNQIFPQTSTIMSLLFFIITLLVICKREIQEIFSINKKHIFWTIGILVTAKLFLTYSLLT